MRWNLNTFPWESHLEDLFIISKDIGRLILNGFAAGSIGVLLVLMGLPACLCGLVGLIVCLWLCSLAS